MNLVEINNSSIKLSNNFDDEIFNIPLISSEKAVNYNFLLSNVISKLVLSD